MVTAIYYRLVSYDFTFCGSIHSLKSTEERNENSHDSNHRSVQAFRWV